VSRALRLKREFRDRRGQALTLCVAERGHAEEYLAHMSRICSETPYMLQSPEDALLTVPEQAKVLERFHSLDNCLCLLVLNEARPVGSRVIGSATFLGGRTNRTQHLCTLGMGVDRDDWGHGVGAVLLDTGLDWARGNPTVTQVTLKVFPQNEGAVYLYSSRGFEREGELRREVRLGVEEHSLIGMGLCVG